MNKDNEIISAHKPDEFFICAYHVKNPNNLKSISDDNQNLVNYFDCNEGDKAISNRLLLQLRQIY
jgi:hypothetical protein